MVITRLFYTTGKQDVIEEEWNKPEPKANEIEVKSVYTGMCRSDIDMYCGIFQLLPKTIQGHESVGIVTKIGKEIHGYKEGDFVATRGEPAFADYYNCKDKMFVRIPALHPKYIIEPVACGINIAKSLQPKTDDDILLLGSGFLSTIVYNILNRYYENRVIVVGHANQDFWSKQDNARVTDIDKVRNNKFNYIIDLSDKPEYLDLNVYNERAIIVLAAEKHPAAVTSFAQFLWNAVDIKFPSPRNDTFYDSMNMAVDLIKCGDIETESLWTKAYDRETEVRLAFSEGLVRPAGYSRGYIEWQK
jgi:D-arabinose 1-dehydrogenase-like Zn-dependent alcohol dehydrogenase